MSAALVVRDQREEFVCRLSSRDRVLLGRDSREVRLRSRGVSRRHAELWCYGGIWYIRDLGSHNGTFVNGVRIEAPTPVVPEDDIRLGGTRVRLRMDGPAAGGDRWSRESWPQAPDLGSPELADPRNSSDLPGLAASSSSEPDFQDALTANLAGEPADPDEEADQAPADEWRHALELELRARDREGSN